jgi:hypothetical protein
MSSIYQRGRSSYLEVLFLPPGVKTYGLHTQKLFYLLRGDCALNTVGIREVSFSTKLNGNPAAFYISAEEDGRYVIRRQTLMSTVLLNRALLESGHILNDGDTIDCFLRDEYIMRLAFRATGEFRRAFSPRGMSFQLHSGRTAYLTEFRFKMPCECLLMGETTFVTQQIHDSAVDVLNKFFGKSEANLVILPEEGDLPVFQLFARLSSSRLENDPEGDSSELRVCWFQDFMASSPVEMVKGVIGSIEWERHALNT